MSDRTFDSAVRDWIDDGSDRTPRHAIDGVLLAIKTTPQQRDLRIPWRVNLMPTYARLAAIVAIVAVVGVGTLTYLGGVAGPAHPSPQPTPTAAPTAPPPTLTPSPAPRVGSFEVQGDSASWTAAVPPGWSPTTGWYTTGSQGPAGPSGIGVVATGAVNVPDDPCDAVGKASTAKSSADVVADLAARKDLTVSTPTATTLGGYPGLRVDVQFPADLGACGTDAYLIFAEPDGSGFHAQGPSNRMRIWVLDIAGRPVVFLVQSFPATPAADLAAAQSIVDSIVIAPSPTAIGSSATFPSPRAEVVKAWPGNHGSSTPGLYSWDGIHCEPTNCIMGVLHHHPPQGAPSGGSVRISISRTTEFSISDANATHVRVAGHEALYMRTNPGQQEWNVDFDGTLMSITISVEGDVDQPVVDEAASIVESLVYEKQDTSVGFRLVFRLPSSEWDSPY